MPKTFLAKKQVMQFFKHSRVGRLLHFKEQGVTFRLALFSVPGVFTIGYLPIAHFFEDKCPSRNAHHGFIPIMKVYPSCFAHQEKSPPGFIPITILPIDWWSFTHHIFTHQRIAHPNI